MWWTLAQAGLSALGAYSSASVNKAVNNANNRVSAAVTDANNRTSAAQAEATNRIRGAGNAFSAARGSLARYMQSVNNSQTLEAGGHALEANMVNARRQDDAMSSASFEDQIRAAEQAGSQVAAAAFAGVGGEVSDMVSVSTRLMQQRAAASAAERRSFSSYDASRRAGVIQAQTIRSLDNSLILDSIDYSINTANTNVASYQQSANPWMAALYAGADSLMKTGLPSGSFAQKSEWGTGSNFGNQDYGNFI